jgi:hypothetical protein
LICQSARGETIICSYEGLEDKIFMKHETAGRHVTHVGTLDIGAMPPEWMAGVIFGFACFFLSDASLPYERVSRFLGDPAESDLEDKFAPVHSSY